MTESTLQEHSLEEIRAWLTERVAEMLETPATEVDPDRSLADYGLDSVSAFTVIADVEDHFGLFIEPTLLWDHPSVNGVSEALLAELKKAGPA